MHNNNIIILLVNYRMPVLINCTCPICLSCFTYNCDKIITMYPCNHLIHNKCINNTINNCPLCQTHIIKTYSLKKLYILQKTNKQYVQPYINVLSLTMQPENTINYSNLLYNSAHIFDVLFELIVQQNMNNTFLDTLLTSTNINIYVKGIKHLQDVKKIYIANHHSILDGLIMYKIFQSGFIAAKNTKNSFFQQLYRNVPIIYIDRYVKNNTVEQIQQHIAKYNNITIFPEGLISHPHTLFEFRTGAFKTSYPIQPIIIKYSINLSTLSLQTVIIKLLEGLPINIYITILPLEHSKSYLFDDYEIANIRNKMASIGHFMLSNVSNYNIMEK